MTVEKLWAEHEAGLEDFWGRRENGPRFVHAFTLFGRPIRVTSNDEQLLTAVALARPQYSLAPTTTHTPFTVHLVVRATPVDPGPPPQNLLAHNQYTGHDQWLSIQMGGWGHCHINLAQGEAIAVLAPALACQPELVSRGLLNTIFTNLVINANFAMLHCTGLLRGEDVLLLLAPHNSGKSTTALRLVLAGYQLISDSQIYVSPDSEGIELLGFPVGRTKLRADMVPHFPQLQPFLTPEPVREEMKYTLDLRRFNAELVCETAVRPRTIHFCLLHRNGTPHTQLTPAPPHELLTAIMDNNSIYYDRPAVWLPSLRLIERLVHQSHGYHLSIGTDPDALVDTINEQLFSS